MTPGFRSRVTTNVVMKSPGGAAAAGGLLGAVGAGMGDLAATGQRVMAQDAKVQEEIADSEARIFERERKRRISAHVADRMPAYAMLQAETELELDELRKSQPPGAPGYAQAAMDLVRQRMTEFQGTLEPEPEVLERFAGMLGELEARAMVRETDYETQTRLRHQSTSLGQFEDITENALRQPGVNQGKYIQALRDGAELYDLLDVDDTTREGMKLQYGQRMTLAFLDSMTDNGNWTGAKQLVDSGVMDAYLEPKAKQSLQRQFEVEEQQVAIQTAKAESEARDAVRTEFKRLDALIDAGAQPTAAELRALRNAADTAGLDPDEIAKIDIMTVRVSTNGQYAGASYEKVVKDRDALRAKMAAGKASQTEQIALDQLESMADKRADEGKDQFEPLLKSGQQGRMAIVTALKGEVTDPVARYERAEKIEPGLGRVTLFDSKTQIAMLNGRQVRKDRPKDFGTDDQVSKQFTPRGTALAGMSSGTYREVMESAQDIYAHYMAQSGRTGWDGAEFDRAIRTATGATYRGATKTWQGGVASYRGRSVLLPPDYTDSEFSVFMQNVDFSAARLPGGRTANKEDILTHYTPLYDGDADTGGALYVMVDASGKALKTAKGEDFVFLAAPLKRFMPKPKPKAKGQ